MNLIIRYFQNPINTYHLPDLGFDIWDYIVQFLYNDTKSLTTLIFTNKMFHRMLAKIYDITFESKYEIITGFFKYFHKVHHVSVKSYYLDYTKDSIVNYIFTIKQPGMDIICNMWNTCQKLTHLTIEDCIISYVGGKILGYHLTTYHNLTHLTWNRNLTSGFDIKHVIKYTFSLTHIHISYINCSVFDLINVVVCSTTIICFELENVDLDIVDNSENLHWKLVYQNYKAKSYVKPSIPNSNLKKVSIKNCVEYDSIDIILFRLLQQTALSDFTWSGCQMIENEFNNDCVNLLNHIKTLTYVDLRENNLSSELFPNPHFELLI